MTSPDLERALRAALATPVTPLQRSALERRLRTKLARPGGRVRSRLIGVLAIAALLAVPAAVGVSAAIRLTESPNGLASAQAFQAEIDAAKRVVPLPAGATWPPYLAANDQSGSYSAGGGRSWVEYVAFCAWDRAWLEATRTGDAQQAATARAVIAGMPAWEFYTGQFATDSSRTAVGAVIADVVAGNTGPVQEFVQVNCGN